jgi:L,D-transpeptidase YcbB
MQVFLMQMRRNFPTSVRTAGSTGVRTGARRRLAVLAMTSLLAGSAAFGGVIDPFQQTLASSATDSPAVAGWYRSHSFQTLWTGPADESRRAVLLAAFDTAADHGLPVSRYDAAALRAAFAAARTEGDRGRLEVAMSKAFVQFATDISSGALNPTEIDPGIKRETHRPDPMLLMAAAGGGDLAGFLAGLAPHAPEYARLMKEKFRLEAKIAAGGFGPTIPAQALEPGETGAAVIALRDRLMALGYLGRSVSASYDVDIQGAVQRFQADRGITPDGVAGEATVAALNAGPEDRLKSVIVAMERLRWLGNAPLGARHIWVNQPSFIAQIVDDGAVTFATRVVVGKVGGDTESPEFSDQMEYMDINPTWSVPRSIVVREYLPQLQANPQAQRQLQVIDRSGRVVARDAVDFTTYTAANFPFALRQPPSDGNALGKVKFMFPNPYNIYLHDTPTKSLFGKEVRAFSHGCIRVGDPFDFAYALLAPQSANPKALFKSYLDQRTENQLMLATPVPVHLVYFTAWPTAQGGMTYYRDIYGRDAAIFAALRDAGVAVSGPQG